MNFDKITRIAGKTLNNVGASWDSKSPGQKAWAVTIGIAVTAVNPLYPVIYASVYGAAAAKQASDELDS